MTVFSDSIFLPSTLYTANCKNKLVATLKGVDGRSIEQLVRNDTRGYCEGRLIEPVTIPDWLVPETVLSGNIQGMKVALTYRGVIQSRIKGITDLLGAKVSFSYMVVTEFN